MLGFEIKKKRKELGLTQADVAGEFMSVAKLSNIENGKVKPDLETWAYLKQKLGVTETIVNINETLENIKLFFSQAETYEKTKLIDKAIEKYLQIVEVSDKNLLYFESAMAYSQLGSIYIDQRNYKLAHSYLIKAIDIFQSTGDLRQLLECKLRLGMLYFKQEQFSKALEYLNLLLSDVPNHLSHVKVSLYYNIATLYYKLNDLDNANYACDKALMFLSEEHEDYLMAVLNLQAILLKRVKMYLMAREKLEQAKQLAVKYNNNSILAKCWHNLGDIELECKNFEKALEYFTLSLDVKEKNDDEIGIIRTTAYLAELFLQMEDLPKALELGSKALRSARANNLKYEELVCLTTLSKIHAARGEKETFLDLSFKAMSLADALSFANKKIEFLETIAKFYHLNGNREKCTEMLYRAFVLKYKL